MGSTFMRMPLDNSGYCIPTFNIACKTGSAGSDLFLDLRKENNRGQFSGLEFDTIIHGTASFSGDQPRA